MLEKTVTTPSLAAPLAPAARAGDDRAATGTADQGEHARALAIYRAHAERGDGNAQEIVALMLWVGDALHGPEVPRDRVAATE